jgi:FixJ family two-component response regulator
MAATRRRSARRLWLMGRLSSPHHPKMEGNAMKVLRAEDDHSRRASRTLDPAPVVYIVDDDISMRESLEGLICAGGWQALAFASAQEFLSHPYTSSPSCLILDVTLPGLSGLDLQDRLASERSDVPIIFITAYGDVPTTVRAMKAGALEFLTKPFNDKALLGAVETGIERSRAALEREAELRMLRACEASLTRREKQVMELVVQGRLNKQVAAELGISEITVKVHRGRAMTKMGASSLADLVMMGAKLRGAFETNS